MLIIKREHLAEKIFFSGIQCTEIGWLFKNREEFSTDVHPMIELENQTGEVPVTCSVKHNNFRYSKSKSSRSRIVVRAEQENGWKNVSQERLKEGERELSFEVDEALPPITYFFNTIRPSFYIIFCSFHQNKIFYRRTIFFYVRNKHSRFTYSFAIC